MRFAAIALALSGCSFTPGALPVGDGNQPSDDGANGDAPGDGTACTSSFSRQLDTCGRGTPGSTLTLSGANSYNTTTGVLQTPGGVVPVTRRTITLGTVAVDFLYVQGFTITAGGYLQVVGDAPFGVLSVGSISIQGTLDGSSSVQRGSGARTRLACGASAGGEGAADANGAPGGGGGALGEAGGNGGNGDGNGSETTGATGGTAITFPAIPLGGCPGGVGGQGANIGGSGGVGGGAIDLIAAGALSVSGTITAGGGGASGGLANTGGGGGGGSGGTILLEASVSTITGTLAANGGAGGGGAGTTAGGPGAFGQSSSVAAPGGSAGVFGSGGGDGGTAASKAGESVTVATPDGGGGGGGGSVGYIAIEAPTLSVTGSTITPSLTPWP